MKLKTIFLTTGLLFTLCVVALAAGIDGKWTGQVEGPQGMMDITFVFKSEGEKLTGNIDQQFLAKRRFRTAPSKAMRWPSKSRANSTETNSR